MKKRKLISGFTLIELLLVIGIIAVLAVVVFVALDPAKRFADARNARRTTDVQSVLSAVHQYIVDNKGAFPPGVDANEMQLGIGTTDCVVAGNGGCFVDSAACLDLSTSLAKYLKTIPFDPNVGSADATYYSIIRDANNIVTVRACGAEGDVEITASR